MAEGWRDRHFGWLLLITFAAFGGAALILLGQCFVWLRYGSWPPIAVVDVLGPWLPPPTGWAGLNRVGRWLAGLPLTLALAWFGIGWTMLIVSEPKKVR